MFRWMIRLVALAAIVWFATMVRLGDRTLWQHMLAIWATPEAQDLKRGTEDEARKVAHQVREDIAESARRDGGATDEHLDADDRRALNKVIQQKRAEPR